MPHTIRLTVALDPPATDAVAAFRADPERWLPTPLRRNGAGAWQLYLWAGEIGVLVDCEVAEARWDGATWRRSLRWRPLRGTSDTLLSRAVPSFDGTLSVVDRHDGVAQLLLTGTYRPPGGVAGSLVDRLALHRLARRTGKIFTKAIAERIHQAARASAV
jgi:hypothetical protein